MLGVRVSFRHYHGRSAGSPRLREPLFQMSVFHTDEPPRRPLPLDDPIYRPRKIAECTGLNYYTIIDAIASGQLGPKVQLGKRAIGVRASGVDRWLKSRKNQSGRPEAD
jgi:predicted DNA-binding transcriptional regulator AlpA